MQSKPQTNVGITNEQPTNRAGAVMDETRAQRIEDKLDKVIDVLKDQNATLAIHSTLHNQNSKDLEHHIKRTDLLEDSLKPLKQTDSAIRFSLKAVGFIALILTLIATYKGLK